MHSDCLSGTLVLPCQGKDGKPLACGYLITAARVVLVDDENALQGVLRRIAREKRWTDGSVGQFLYDFFEQLIARDLHGSKSWRTASRRSRTGYWRTSSTAFPRR